MSAMLNNAFLQQSLNHVKQILLRFKFCSEPNLLEHRRNRQPVLGQGEIDLGRGHQGARTADRLLQSPGGERRILPQLL